MSRGLQNSSLQEVFDLERSAGAWFAEKYIGHGHLASCAQSFALDTILSVSKEDVVVAEKTLPGFWFVFIDLMMLFRRLRGASVLTANGYPGSALVLLRDVKHRTIYLSALFQRRVTHDALMGISASDPQKATAGELNNRRRRQRKQTELDLLDRFYGRQSELSPEDVELLSSVTELLDRETHGSFLSAASEALRWKEGKRGPSLVAVDDERSFAMFMNRQNEFAWMYHRLLPNLQVTGKGFGEVWAKHWELLDNCFWQTEVGLDSLGKKIGAAFVRFIDQKFPFSATTRLTLAKQN